MSTEGDVDLKSMVSKHVDKMLYGVREEGIIAGFTVCKEATRELLKVKDVKLLSQIEIDILMDEMIGIQRKLMEEKLNEPNP